MVVPDMRLLVMLMPLPPLPPLCMRSLTEPELELGLPKSGLMRSALPLRPSELAPSFKDTLSGVVEVSMSSSESESSESMRLKRSFFMPSPPYW